MFAGLELGALSCTPEGFTAETVIIGTHAIAEAISKAIIRATQSCTSTVNGIASVENEGWVQDTAFAAAEAVHFQRGLLMLHSV